MTKTGMDDPWSSVENMLRWHISLARKSVAEHLERLPEIGELYPLRKYAKSGAKPDGLPEHWAFGSLTRQQLSLSDALRGLRGAESTIQRAEAALVEGRLPESINLIVHAYQSINSALALWHSSGAITTWRYVGKVHKAQAIRAGRSRATVSADDEKFSMTELARGLVAKTDRLGDPIPAMQLWDELIGLLNRKCLDPKEDTDKKNGFPVVKFISRYDGTKAVYDSYKFTSFSVTVSKLRRKKKLT